MRALLVALLAASPAAEAQTPEAAAASAAAALSPEERRAVEWIDRHAEEELAALRAVVDVDSGTSNLRGVREVGMLFERRLAALGFATRWVSLPEAMRRAGHLVAERLGPGAGKRVLLVGHLDTVVEGERFRRDGEVVRGSGVGDMKGGDVVILYALEALRAAGLLDGAVRVVLTGDEESPGRPTEISRGALVAAARESDVALCFEADVGRVTVARRGTSDWTLEVTGVQGHSAGILQEEVGAGAIYEAARIVDRFRQAFGGQRSITVSPSLALGGTDVARRGADAGSAAGKVNVVPRSAVVRGDLRFLTEEERRSAEATMRRIASAGLPKTSARLGFEEVFPSMPPTPGNLAVLSVVDGAMRALGQGPAEPLDPLERGAGDFSFIAGLVSGVDGLGVAGDGAHGPHETMRLDSLARSTKRAAVVVARLLRQPPGPRRPR